MVIPALFDVEHHSYAGVGENAHGNEIDQWAAPVVKKFITWADYSTSEPSLAGHERDLVTAGILVYPPDGSVPAEWRWFGATPKPKDKMRIDGDLFEVVGQPVRADKAWFNTSILNWRINLKQVNG
ncbi:hypothetical protein WKY82_09235 [Gordonia malaquae]|uniref:hypothetical protein n=1 Tax=Gordonia malaquae TaxID=410332 RepID=UPI0030C78AD5